MELILPCGSAILNVNTANFVSRLVRLHVLTKTWCFLSSLSHMSPVCSSPLFPHVCCLLMSPVSSCLLSPHVSCLLMSPFLISPIPLCNLFFLSLVLSFFRSIPVHCILFSHEPFMSPVTHVSYLLMSTITSCPLSLTFPISSCPLSPNVPCHSRILSPQVHYLLMSPVPSCLMSPVPSCFLFIKVSCLLMSPSCPLYRRSPFHSCFLSLYVPCITMSHLHFKLSCPLSLKVCCIFQSSFSSSPLSPHVPYPLKSPVSSSPLSPPVSPCLLHILRLLISPLPSCLVSIAIPTSPFSVI